MLVLTRKKNEQIVIPLPIEVLRTKLAEAEKAEAAMLPTQSTIVISISEIKGDKVRLGVEADRDIPVHRREIWDVIQVKKADG